MENKKLDVDEVIEDSETWLDVWQDDLIVSSQHFRNLLTLCKQLRDERDDLERETRINKLLLDYEYPCDFFRTLIQKNSPYAFYLFQWVDYHKEASLYRLKLLHDVKTFDGREAFGVYPNADSFGPFKDNEVQFIRISKKQFGYEWKQGEEYREVPND